MQDDNNSGENINLEDEGAPLTAAATDNAVASEDQVATSPVSGDDKRDELKHKVLTALKPIASQIEDPEARSYILMDILREKWDDSVAEEIYNLADDIKQTETKARIYQNLLSEINYRNSEK